MSAAFLGIDLAWSPRNPSGVAALSPAGGDLEVAAVGLAGSDQEIAGFVEKHSKSLTVLLVDAPLVVPNETGMRECEGLLNRRFARFQAACYPSNRARLRRYNGGVPRGEAVGTRLRPLGFPWPPGELSGPRAGKGHWVFECYPHPAQVVLFRLERTLKYKKKLQPWAEVHAEHARYLELLGSMKSPAVLLPAGLRAEMDAASTRGRAYKAREDRLDALFCAYLAALVPEGRMEMIGRPDEGSIVVPRG